MKTKLTIAGITCGNCVKAVEGALKGLSGGKDGGKHRAGNIFGVASALSLSFDANALERLREHIRASASWNRACQTP
ncbi:MAG: heavy-metal-associated domain-containing protein [Spirochaetaceae bacterium]|jgi:copper chaperone CopZ|nr:heavy-metal-associated domain-containing protein [Spirochaetaceae bacterium]